MKIQLSLGIQLFSLMLTFAFSGYCNPSLGGSNTADAGEKHSPEWILERIAQLRSESPELRIEAAEQLSKTRNPRVIGPVSSLLLFDDSEAVRLAAARALSRFISRPDVVRSFLRYSNTNEEAKRALVDPENSLFLTLTKLFRDEGMFRDQQLSIIEVLGERADEGLRGFLDDTLENSKKLDPSCRTLVQGVLEGLGRRPYPAPSTSDKKSRDEVAPATKGTNPTSGWNQIRWLLNQLDQLESNSPRARKEAADQLARARHPDTLPHIRELLFSSDIDTRMAAARAMSGFIPDPEVVELLLQSYNAEAELALVGSDKEIFPVLASLCRKYYSDKSSFNRMLDGSPLGGVIEVLVARADPELEEFVKDLLADSGEPDSFYVSKVKRAFGSHSSLMQNVDVNDEHTSASIPIPPKGLRESGDRNAKGIPLEWYQERVAWLESESPLLRMGAADQLARTRNTEVVPQLRALLDSEFEGTRLAAARALSGFTFDPGVVAELLGHDSNPEAREALISSENNLFPMLAKYFDAAEGPRRATIAEIMAYSRDPDVVGFLEDALKNWNGSNDHVKYKIEIAVSHARGAREQAEFEEKLMVPPDEKSLAPVRAHGTSGFTARPRSKEWYLARISSLESTNSEERMIAANELSRVPHPYILDELKELLGSESEGVRLAAARALSGFTSSADVVELLVDQSSENEEARNALVNADTQVFPILTMLYQESRAARRIGIVEVLGHRSEIEIVPFLESVQMKVDDSEVNLASAIDRALVTARANSTGADQ